MLKATGMTRQDFQHLALERIDDAQALLQAQRYSGAYYVAGYAIECALKACIARQTRQDDFPPRDAQRHYTHDVTKLRDGAGLAQDHTEQPPALQANWAVVKDWTEEARYQSFTQQQAAELLTAINDPQNGVLQWLRGHW